MARKPKEKPQDEPPPEVGHNGVTQDQFLSWVRAAIKANEALEVAKLARSKMRKQAKAAGIELGHMDEVIAMAEWEPGEIREHFRIQQQYAEWMALPVGTRLDLLKGVPDAALSDFDWQAKGFAAATTGRGAFGEAPDDCPADQVQNWMKGWTRGQAFNAPSPLRPDPPPALAKAEGEEPDEPTEDETVFH